MIHGLNVTRMALTIIVLSSSTETELTQNLRMMTHLRFPNPIKLASQNGFSLMEVILAVGLLLGFGIAIVMRC